MACSWRNELLEEYTMSTDHIDWIDELLAGRLVFIKHNGQLWLARIRRVYIFRGRARMQFRWRASVEDTPPRDPEVMDMNLEWIRTTTAPASIPLEIGEDTLIRRRDNGFLLKAPGYQEVIILPETTPVPRIRRKRPSTS